VTVKFPSNRSWLKPSSPPIVVPGFPICVGVIVALVTTCAETEPHSPAIIIMPIYIFIFIISILLNPLQKIVLNSLPPLRKSRIKKINPSQNICQARMSPVIPERVLFIYFTTYPRRRRTPNSAAPKTTIRPIVAGSGIV